MDENQEKELALLAECNKYLQENDIPIVSSIHDQIRFRKNVEKTHDQDSLIEFVIKEKKYDLAKKLIENGVFCDLENNKGSTPLIRACIQGNEEIVDLLLTKKEVNVNHEDRRQLATPIIFATIANQKNIVKKLIDHGAFVTMKDVELCSALDHARNAIGNDCLEILQAAENEQIKSKSKTDKTPNTASKTRNIR